MLPTEEILTRAFTELNLNNIYPRRYFYPSLSKLPYVMEQNTPVCDDISTRVLCLPIYYGLSKEEIDFVCRILLRVQNN
jgi:dTDP-4-amino-4,6-dideoxygalactose transaminase